jgi:hypothetical protein
VTSQNECCRDATSTRDARHQRFAKAVEWPLGARPLIETAFTERHVAQHACGSPRAVRAALRTASNRFQSRQLPTDAWQLPTPPVLGVTIVPRSWIIWGTRRKQLFCSPRRPDLSVGYRRDARPSAARRAATMSPVMPANLLPQSMDDRMVIGRN